MKTANLFRLLSAALLVLVAVCALPAAPRRESLPFQCFTQPWQASFEVVSTRLDKPGKRIVWVLKAKKDVRVPAYEAWLGDVDGVEQATRPVKFDPDRKKVKAGTRIEAVVTLGALSVSDFDRVIIRQRR
jgi:hypothetical protein